MPLWINGSAGPPPYVNEAYDAFADETDDTDDKCMTVSDDSYVSSDDDDDEEEKKGDPGMTSPGDIEMKTKKRKSSKKKSPKTWDVFRESSADNLSSEDLELWNKVFIVTKVIYSGILLTLVLATAVLSKSTLFLIVANILPPSNRSSFPVDTDLKTNNGHFRYANQDTAIAWIWSLVLVVIAPYFLTVVLSCWTLIFKKTRPLEYMPLFVAILVETLHSIGLNLFIFGILPNVDPVTGALLCTNIAVVPSLLNQIYLGTSDTPYQPMKQVVLKRLLKGISLVASVAALGVWAYHAYNLKESAGLLVIFIISPILLSFKWWENFVPQGDHYSQGLKKLKRQLRSRRTKVSALVHCWKIIMTVAIVSMVYGIDCQDGTACIGTLFNRVANATLNSATFGETELVQHLSFGTCTKFLPLLIAAVNIVASAVCYRLCVSACKILAQVASFAIPLALTTPLTVALMLGVYTKEDMRMTDGCSLPFPQWVDGLEFDWSMILPSILGYVAVVLITSYVWIPSSERMQREEKLFVTPLYCGVLLDQSMLLNRRKDDEDTKGVDEKERETELPIPENIEDWNPGDDWSPLRKDDTPFIYLCATMWHEVENEMTQILKSLFRMDEDQCARRNLQLFFGIRDPDYYEFEAHIFFDDAFDYSGDEAKANGYVKQLIRTIDVAVSSVHSFGMKIAPPTKVDTPYGGRLIWRLPGGNRMIAHLKDKAKIRHRKRWSQVMYMYYFLGHKLLSMGGGKERIRTIADNTFLLALDGDVDFQPSALRLLVDRMKRNPNVGAACGRIHPIGSGPMVWYQKFEYAVSHWLQKATEHTIGCVLCSPGCFSLFRGSSVMDDNVMRRYTTPPTEARHYVQYDQGEDRWLCTLLLQQGYRVEYCAASDALTYAPEGFYEFYNQRRRWTPSTMANILDLLMDWKNVTRRNNDISSLYIAYQMLLMVSSILTPGTIFLLVLGAITMAYPDLPLFGSLLLNLFPVAIFILLCFVAKSDIQLAYAAILSTVYSLVMMLVIVGLLRQAAQNGFCSVTTVFLCAVAGIFVVSAFLHPQEFWCVIHGFLYFLAIPSMSMLLMLYSLGNLHVVSWGTRETPKPAAAPKPGETNKPAPKKGAVHEMLEKLGFSESTGTSEYMFSFGNLFRCLCCPTDPKENEDVKLRAILERLDDIEAKIIDQNDSHVTGMSLPAAEPEPEDHMPFSQASGLFEGAGDRDNPLYREKKKKATPWIVDKDLMEGPEETLRDDEVKFWKEMIETYLFPLEEDKKQQEKTKEELIELRNTVCLFFLLINALFVTIVFTLQQISAESGTLAIDLPCAEGGYGEAIEPISFAFTAVFGILLAIQFICMIFHRMSTFLHICSITEVKIRRPKKLKQKDKEITVEKGLNLVRDMMGGKVASQRRDQRHGTLSQNFIHNFKKLQQYMEDEDKGGGPRSAATIRGARTSLSMVPEEEGDEERVDLHKLQTVRRKFNRFERKSLFTIVQISKDQRLKKSILQRGNVVASRWHRAALRAKLKSAAAGAATGSGADGTDGGADRPSSKVTIADIARLAIAERDSNAPSEEGEDERF